MKNWILLTSALLVSQLSIAQNKSLRVALASSLIHPVREIVLEFEKENAIQVELIPGASGTLASQVMNGAPFDVFISADMKYKKILLEAQAIDAQTATIANGKLVAWSRFEIMDYPAGLIDNHQVKTVAIAQPEIAPYGLAAKKYLQLENLWQNIKPKLVYANNISLINQYISSSAVDFAITSQSSQFQLEKQTQGYWYVLNEFDLSLEQIACMIKNSHTKAENELFLNYLNSSKAQAILVKYGYNIP